MLAELLASGAELAVALEASAVGRTVRGSATLYPWLNVAHLGGLVMLVGAIGILDLRVIGLGRTIPLAPLSRLLTPIAIVGLLLLLGTGVLMFAADAGPLFGSNVFRWKMVLLALALVNALVFRRLFGDLGREPSMLARLMALGSLGLWLTIGALGRLIAYY
jgi:hypothetical protein